MKKGFVLCFAFVALSVRATTLDDLSQTLSRLPAKSPFAAMDVVQLNAAAGEDLNRGGKSSFEIESGPRGFTIVVSPATIEAAAKEAAAKKRDPNVATRRARRWSRSTSLTSWTRSLQLRCFSTISAARRRSKRATLNGKPVKLVRIKVKPSLATRSRFVAEPQIELKIWIGADGLPVAAERVSGFAAGVGFVTAGNARTERWMLATSGIASTRRATTRAIARARWGSRS